MKKQNKKINKNRLKKNPIKMKTNKIVKGKNKKKGLVLIDEDEDIEDIAEIDDSEDAKTDEYDKKSCGFLNESDSEEELEEDGLELEDIDKEHFDDKNE
ncbi:MAG: hypothetical protein Q8N99_01390 [Nanoarchaeota archaeon]|nr:hypothetical protein [Nanoarchaeota archaeon]